MLIYNKKSYYTRNKIAVFIITDNRIIIRNVKKRFITPNIITRRTVFAAFIVNFCGRLKIAIKKQYLARTGKILLKIP